jgi:uncharacterized damage-inducible protein DinB
MSERKFYINFEGNRDHATEYLLGILEDTRLTTIQTIRNIAVPELHWQYKEGWNTIGALLSHLTALEHYFRIEYVEGRPLTEEENKQWEPALDMGEFIPLLITSQPVEPYIDGLRDSRQQLLESMNNVTFEDLSRRIKGYDPENGCNLAWVLFHMIEDEIYHRGQISYLRKLYKENQQ